MPLNEYLAYCDGCEGTERPLYLFDKDFCTKVYVTPLYVTPLSLHQGHLTPLCDPSVTDATPL